MQVAFQSLKEDFESFFKYFFRTKQLSKQLLYWALFAFIISAGFSSKDHFVISAALLRFFIVYACLSTFFILIPYLAMKRKLGRLDAAVLLQRQMVITLQQESIVITNDGVDSILFWDGVRKAGIRDQNLFINLYSGELYLIPLRYFATKKEVNDFLNVLLNGIIKGRSGSNYRKIRNLYYWGLLGLVPNVGVIAGIILVVNGIRLKAWKLACVGIADVAFTFVFWFFFLKFTPAFAFNGFNDLSQKQLNGLVKNVEFYKLENGHYPDNLKQLISGKDFVDIYDPILPAKKGQSNEYYYQKVGEKYLLISVGRDGLPNTKDDLYPDIIVKDSSKVGFIKRK